MEQRNFPTLSVCLYVCGEEDVNIDNLTFYATLKASFLLQISQILPNFYCIARVKQLLEGEACAKSSPVDNNSPVSNRFIECLLNRKLSQCSLLLDGVMFIYLPVYLLRCSSKTLGEF